MGNIYLQDEDNVSIVIKGNREKMCDCCEEDLVDYESQIVRFGDEEIYYVCYKCLDKANELRAREETD